MEIEFDADKDAANQAKHGVTLALAAELEWETALSWPDQRRDYGEARRCALVILGQRLYLVAYVQRGRKRRVISLRKANAREVKRYVENS